MKITERGGHCRYGECYSELIIEKNGDYAWAQGAPGAAIRRKGRISAQEVLQLTAQIKATKFATIKARKFIGTCPRAYDGRERTYIFNTAEGIAAISACTYEVDSTLPLFHMANDLIAGIYARER
ncbi:MAG: hypothetical protein AAB268_12825 [Elusimicrobiota bacterium]